jgi:hypothetical protein
MNDRIDSIDHDARKEGDDRAVGSVFASEAPAYWAAGFSVIPLIPGTKRPAIVQWTGYCNNLPSEQKRTAWLKDFAGSGVGVLLGTEVVPGFRLIAIDIDDERLAKPAKALLGSACAKVGKKGITIFVKAPVDEKMKATTLTGPEGQAGDLLASGRMTVIPPSIHPDTGRPYRWIGKPLLDIGFERLPVFDGRLLAVLTCLCRSEYAAALHSGEGTHTPAVHFSAQLVRAGATDVEIEAIVGACLPANYDGNTLDELPRMIASAREKGFGNDDIDEGDAPMAIRIVAACFDQGIELFRWEDEAFVSFPTESGGCLTYPLRKRATERRIRQIWYERERRSIGPMVLNEVIATLETQAFAGHAVIPVWNRVGQRDGDIFVDLGDEEGRLVRIGPSGWSLVHDPRVKFRRPDGFKKLPVPQRPGDLRGLQKLLGLTDETFYAVAGFMLSSMGPNGPYLGLVIEGEMGSGKSVLASTLKALLDPSDADRLSLPSKEQDIAIHAKQFRVLSYDNASGMKGEISDTLCIVATGGGLATRKLYTDDELSVLRASRPFMLNGISGYAKRPDLLERVIYVHLERPVPEARKEEETLKADFDRLGPTILAGLYDAVAFGLANHKTKGNATGLRMADAARRIAVSEGALGVSEGTLIEAVRSSQKMLLIERVNADALTIALRGVLGSNPFEGTVKQLFDRLRMEDREGFRGTPASLSHALERQRPALQEVGIEVTILKRGKQGRRVRVEYVGSPDDAPKKETKSRPY